MKKKSKYLNQRRSNPNLGVYLQQKNIIVAYLKNLSFSGMIFSPNFTGFQEFNVIFEVENIYNFIPLPFLAKY